MYGILISSVTVGAGGAATIDFTSIPQTYTDLVLVVSSRSDQSTTTAQNMYLTINGSGFSTMLVSGDGVSATTTSGAAVSGLNNSSAFNANTFSSNFMHFPNYTNAVAHHYSIDAVQEHAATSSVRASLIAGLTTSTAAITSISISGQAGNLVQYSTAYLYGLLKGSGGATVA